MAAGALEVSKLEQLKKFGSGFGSLVGPVGQLYSASESKAQWAVVNQKLDRLIEGQEQIKERLESLFSEVQFASVKGLMQVPCSNIVSRFDQFKLWVKNAEDEEGYLTKKHVVDDIERWSGKVLTEGVTDLAAIHNGIMGLGMDNEQILMRIYGDKIKNNRTTQAEYYRAVTFYENLMAIQQYGIICYGNAKAWANKDISWLELVKEMEPVTKSNGQGRSSLQAAKSEEALKSLNRYYSQNPGHNTEGGDFAAFGISSRDTHDLHGIQDTPLVADRGQVIVGFQFYGHYGRLMLRLAQAPFSNGKVDPPKIKDAPAVWIDNWSGAENYFARVQENLKKGRPLLAGIGDHEKPRALKMDASANLHTVQYVSGCEAKLDTNYVEIPAGEVVTGAQLYYKGSDGKVLTNAADLAKIPPRTVMTIALRLQAAKLDANGNLDESSRHWVDSPAKENYVWIRNKAKYVSYHALLPQPLAPIRGAYLYLHDDGSAYFVRVAIKTGIYDISNTWKRFDMIDGQPWKLSLK